MELVCPREDTFGGVCRNLAVGMRDYLIVLGYYIGFRSLKNKVRLNTVIVLLL